jgi:hypothetical protein
VCRCIVGRAHDFSWGAVEWGIWIDSVCVQLPLVPYTYYRGDQRVLCISLACVFLHVDILFNLPD